MKNLDQYILDSLKGYKSGAIKMQNVCFNYVNYLRHLI